MLNHPRKRFTIHHVGGPIGTAHRIAFSCENVVASFKETGCFSLDEDLLLILTLLHHWFLKDHILHLIHMQTGKKCTN